MTKHSNLTPFGRLFVIAASFSVLSVSANEEIVDAPTHTQLLEQQTKQVAEIKRKQALAPKKTSAAEEAPRARKPTDLVGRSTILSFGGSWTIVPKGAVLHIPDYLRARVEVAQQGSFVAWKEFYAKNRGWIHLQDVKMEQARGEKEMAEGLAETYPKIGRVVVAVCHGGPISLRPFVQEKANPAVQAGSGAIPVRTP